MDFICKSCQIGADLPGNSINTLEAKRNQHLECKGGTHCDCQHRVTKKSIV